MIRNLLAPRSEIRDKTSRIRNIVFLFNLFIFLWAFVQVNAVYVFDIEEEGRWHVDMTSGSGSVGEGDPPQKPDVTVVVNKENFLKVGTDFHSVAEP